MIKMKSLIATSIILALTACDGGDEEVSSSANSIGTLEIIGTDFFAGAPLSVSLNDTDGVVDGTVTYSWVRDPSSSNPVELSTTSSYTLTEADERENIQVTALYSTDSGLFKSVKVITDSIRPTLDVSAFIIKGPVNSAVCNIFEIDESGVAGTVSHGTSTSETSGAVTFTNVNFEGNGLISCAGGTYTDESTGNTLTAPTLRAVVDVVEDVVVVELDADGNDNSIVAPDYIVSPLTELAVQAAADDLTMASEAAESINARFGIRFDTTETSPTIIGVDDLGTDGAGDADQYGVVLALISQLNADDADSDLGTILSELATDLSDGTFSDDTQTAFETAQTNLETTSVVSDEINSDLFIAIGAAVGYNNDPIPAIIEGTLNGTVNNSSTIPLTGEVTVLDLNFEEDAIIAQTDVVLTYGTFSITADGSWSYIVDTVNETVAALELGNSVNELVTITSVDETTATIDIKIAALTQVAKISDIGGDTGEIRFSVNNLRQGKLSASFLKEETRGSDDNIKDAYITLYGSSGSSSEALIDLRIQGNEPQDDGSTRAPRFLVRNTDNAAYTGGIITAPFVEQQFYDVDISWDLDATDQITVSIDGEVIGGGAFSTAAVVDSDFTNLDQWFADGVKSIQFRLGDNDRNIPRGSYFVDNIMVYSDIAGEVKVFEDDFESYTEGETLDAVGSLYSLAIYSEVIPFEVADPNAAVPADFRELTGAINSDTATATGQVKVFDNADEAFITESTFTGTYGTLAITEDGSWTYTLDTANTTIAALIVGERETDTFTISSVDGTEADLVITISGTIVVDTGANNVARMANALYTTYVVVDGVQTVDADGKPIEDVKGADAELRLTTDPITAGSISATIKTQAIAGFTPTGDNVAADGGTVGIDNTAYISIYGGSSSSGNLTGEVIFSDGAVKYRDASKSQQIIEGLTYADDTPIDVVLSWDATGYSISLDGGQNFSASFTGIKTGTATETYQIRIGSSKKESSEELIVDNIVITDTSGATAVEVLSEDFESGFAAGDDLSNTYSSSAEAIVVTEAAVSNVDLVASMANALYTTYVVVDGVQTVDADGKAIEDVKGADAELRLTTDPITAGSISATIKTQAIAGFTPTGDDVAADGGTVGIDNTAYISIYGGSASSGNLTGEVIFSDGAVKYRDASKSQQIIEGLTYADDTPIDVVLSWDATGYSISLDGGQNFSASFTGIKTGTATETYQIRIGSSKKESSEELIVDNIVITDTSGATDVEVLSEDFESGFAVGDDLSTTYSSSAEATVKED